MGYTAYRIDAKVGKGVRYDLGIDIGSTTVKYVVVDDDGRIVASAYVAHETRQAPTLLRLLEDLHRSDPKLYNAVDKVYITGSGASRIAPTLNARFVQEVNAVGVAVEHLHPDVRGVIELGGQDAKILHFIEDDEGNTRIIASMNDKCASGTGATIEKCTLKTGLSLEALRSVRFDATKLHHVAAKCGVFAETDIVNLVKSSVPAEEIMNSLADAIVMQNLTVLTRGQTLKPRVLLLGGPNTYLPFLQECWRMRIAEIWKEREIPFDETQLDKLVFVPKNAQYYAALGAVLFGRNEKIHRESFCGTDKLRALAQGRIRTQSPYDDAPLVESEEELEAFKRRYAIPRFTPPRINNPVTCYLGIDGGSTSSKAVLIDEKGALLRKFYRLSQGNPIDDVVAILKRLRQNDPEGHFRIAGLGVTGYAADVLTKTLGADANIVETIAHMHSAQAIFGESVDVICDVGGQDIKVLFLQNGMLKHFRLSNQCSAGNGALLQSMAAQFNVKLEDFADIAFSAPKAPKFNYGCAVFLDTDRVTFQKEGYTKEELFAGIAKVLPKNIWQYVVQAVHLELLGSHFVLQGGTQYNQAALKAQIDYIRAHAPSARIDVHPHPGEAGAIGAALEARNVVRRKGKSEFIGLEEATGLRYTTRTDETTRCTFCSMGCSRTFIDTLTPSGKRVRYIAGFACEDGTVESKEALKALRAEQKKRRRSVPNLVEEEAAALFRPLHLTCDYPDRAEMENVTTILGIKWTRRISRPFRKPDTDTLAMRARLRIALPRVLSLYSVAPFIRGYLESLGIAPLNILFSTQSDETMFLQGAKYGAVDTCYPAKVAQSHIYQLLYAPRFRNKAIDYIWFPAVTHLPNYVRHTVADTACPVVSGTPQVVKSAFIKEQDLFAKHGIAYLDGPLNFSDEALLEHQLFSLWKEPLKLSPEENRYAMRKGFEALRDYDAHMQAKGRALLERAEANGEVVLLLLGRPYHLDSGLNHEILESFQALGYAVLTQTAIPKDEAYLHRFFNNDIKRGIIADVFDIRDVWEENYSTNSAQKVWAAKFAARHPNVAVVDISSFKCGHDAPAYAIIERILAQTRTPHLTLHDLDANKPSGSFQIRIKTFDYTLKRYRESLKGASDAT
jgi:predicted CoA-substrate-specific enzyme activase